MRGSSTLQSSQCSGAGRVIPDSVRVRTKRRIVATGLCWMTSGHSAMSLAKRILESWTPFKASYAGGIFGMSGCIGRRSVGHTPVESLAVRYDF